MNITANGILLVLKMLVTIIYHLSIQKNFKYLVQLPISIYDRLVNGPNIPNLFLTFNYSSYSVRLILLPGCFSHHLSLFILFYLFWYSIKNEHLTSVLLTDQTCGSTSFISIVTIITLTGVVALYIKYALAKEVSLLRGVSNFLQLFN